MKIASVVALAAALLLTSPQPFIAPAVAQTAPVSEINERTVQVGSQRVHYLQAGSGPTTIVLLHGWPQSSHEWRRIMPRLADRYTVIAPDLRGIGGTTAPSADFTKAALARDVHGLLEKLERRRVVLVGHDIGGMVAYAYARQFPRELIGLAILDVPLPGVADWATLKTNPVAWHFDFHNQKPLAEQLVAGRQFDYFRYIINSNAKNPAAIVDADVAAYATAYNKPDNLTAGFELYRAFPADEKFNASRKEPLDVPVLLVGGDGSFGPALPSLERGLRSLGVRNIRRAVIPNCGHWLPEEQPADTANEIANFAADFR